MTIRNGRFLPKELFACSQNLEPRNASAIAFCTWIISATKLGASCPLRIGEVTESFNHGLGDGEHVTCGSFPMFCQSSRAAVSTSVSAHRSVYELFREP